MANVGSGITAWLFSDWDDNLLDVLLFGWIGWAALVIVVVNALLTFFGPLKPRDTWDSGIKGTTGAVVQAGTGSESCQWLNSGLNWFYLHYDKFPDFVDAWVKALNEQVVKLGGPVQVKFEQVKPGSLPPKFSDVTFEAGPENKYVIKCKVDSKDLSFAVFASQQTAEGVKLTNLTASILKLKGSLRLRCYLSGRDMMAEVSFEGRPNVKIVGKPVNPYQDPSDLVDIQVVQEVVRNAICLATTNINITQWITGDSQNLPRAHEGGNKTPTKGSIRRSEAMFEPIEAKQTQSAFHAPSLGTAMPRPARPSPTVEKKLLIKVIKASALGSKPMGGVDPACVVFMDTPPQSQSSSVVRSTANPFWDEQFLFDVNSNTREIKFEVFDRSKPAGGESFLGEATVYYDDLRRNPSSRQIIPLQGVMDDGNLASGSITVEFRILDSSEIEAMGLEVNENITTPKRTIQVNQSKTPGGTLVTTTTMTTQKPLNARYDAHVDESPSYIEKRNVFEFEDSEGASIDRISPNVSSIPTQDHSLSSSAEVILVNGGESVAEAAIRELTERKTKKRTPSKTTTLIITGTKRTTESSPSQEIQNEGVPMVTTQPPSPGQHENREKKKGSSLARQIKKRFSRSKKRSRSADRGGSLREGSNYLQPPGQGQQRAKDDLELVRGKEAPSSPNLKKSRSLGGSLKKLFRRGRKQSRSRGDTSRESSFSRSSAKNVSQGPSREGSLNRTSDPQEMQQYRQTLIT
ncbi:hypothetical protein FSP39_001393 [Pinctada imbricata]|uniref:C2 domain-containing protein n=1 Tax=Pinctada imbricata TaxID=66713 RepID=A0AA88YK55_PINIB|nr:hypothetical protein FSP39_001393 [Pinctada imbricata]